MRPVGGARISKYNDVLAWQLMAGIGLKVSEHLALDVGYRYFAARNGLYDGLPAAASPYHVSYTNAAAMVGLRWSFASLFGWKTRPGAETPPPQAQPVQDDDGFDDDLEIPAFLRRSGNS